MKLCSIVPTPWLGKVPLFTDTHLILAQEVAKTPQYGDFYRKRCMAGDYIIVDNGAFEKEDVDVEGVLEAAHKVYVPNCGGVEVVAPEVMGDVDGSISKFLDFVELLNKRNITYFRIMVVLQGENSTEVQKMHNQIVPKVPPALRSIITYGIPKYLGDLRPGIVKDLTKNKMPSIHLLGLVGAADRKNELAGVRSLDTSYPATVALLDLPAIPYDGGLKSPTRPDHFFEQPEPTDRQIQVYQLAYEWLRKEIHAVNPISNEVTLP